MGQKDTDIKKKDDETERLIKGFNHPLRREILRRLAQQGRPLSPVEAGKDLDASLSKVSYHFEVLAELGLIALAATRPVRGAAEHFYEPDQQAFRHPIVPIILQEGAATCP